MSFLEAIQQRELELKRDHDDLVRLKQRYPGYDFLPVDNRAQSNEEVQEEQTTPPATPAPLSALEKSVLATINTVSSEWVCRQVVVAMRTAQMRLPNTEDAAMNAVGLALSELTARGLINRVHTGRPHRYQRIEV